jgi:hypothetical protein
VAVRIATSQPRRRISPLIYGVAHAGPEDLAALRPRLNRWGGNPNSRHNWELNAWNAARDWEFRNYGDARPEDRRPSGVADRFVAETRAAGAEPVITIPALGWVARDQNNETRSRDVPRGGGPPIAGPAGPIAGYDPTANRAATSIRSLARKGRPFEDPPDLDDDRVYQDEWVYHLVHRFGPAAQGGVRYYVIDNEPDLWSETHTDVHPVQPGYQDLLDVFIEYAEAIKDVDPGARILGPALSGWTGLFFSPRDRGADNFRTHAERRAHGGVPFLPWWLEQVRRHDERAGRRTLDVLDVHYYPQGPHVFSERSDPATNALRLRATRALWDPTYVDESWIREPVWLIPRLRGWIERSYPGTLLAIGEWNWGAEKTVNGALAVADVLGIFGREGVDLAAYWTVPPRGSPSAFGFAMYTNYDGRGASFGDESLAVRSPLPPDDLSVYASRASGRPEITVIAINKRPDRQLALALVLDDFAPAEQARLYRYDASQPAAIRDLGEVRLDGRQLTLTLPPYSITLARVGR